MGAERYRARRSRRRRETRGRAQSPRPARANRHIDHRIIRGSDGKDYKVCAYDRMRRDESILDGQDRWLPSGVIEYRLDGGGVVEVRADGTLAISHSGVSLAREA